MLDISPPLETSTLNREQLIERAHTIAAELMTHVQITPRNGFTWIGPSGYGTEQNPLKLLQLRADLYNGTTGIAIFFASLAKVSNNSEFALICYRILEPVRHWLRLKLEGSTSGVPLKNIGALIGIGSITYALLRISEILNDEQLRREAHATVKLFAPELIERDTHGRIQTGAAGAIFSLLAIVDGSGSHQALDAAKTCGEQLLALQSRTDERPPAWPVSRGKPALIGFSYGASGISLSLRRLFAVTEDKRFLKAAENGEAFIQSHYSPEFDDYFDPRVLFQRKFKPKYGTWKDWWANGTDDALEENAVPAPLSASDLLPCIWCHGSPGIAAARIAGLAWNDGPQARHEIEVGLRAAMARPLDGPADLCCGIAGIIDVLLFASTRLQTNRFKSAAETMLQRLLKKLDSQGEIELSAARGRPVFAPTLFQGLAGIGYLMLRAAEPTLPCLLVLE